MPPASAADTIRILVATDNHVGFEERDPIRKDDSWRSFDEIMQMARLEDVDMVLLGGDLFHDNKPSRKSMYQVMRSLRKNCLGDRPCELQFLSDAAEVFEGAFQNVNYEDPDINISIPVFSIHGNHDDPSGDGHFCSLDLLQVAGLVNYFGRVPEADNIQVKPILLQKGGTKLALYGLSNVRDERMFRTFRDNKVRFFQPNQQKHDFFNLLTVHQNHHAHTPTSYLPENMLPDFLDLVVWGHEHECLIDPQRNQETGFHVMQPGSSVATSLCPGEAVTKHVAILSITGKQFDVQKIPLKTVRPFVTRELVLASDKRFKGLEKKQENRHEITKRLMVIVDEMIAEANDQWQSIHTDADPSEQPLPLIRLKVEYTAPEGFKFEVENPQRFSNRFAGKVANQNDVVVFYRKKTGTTRQKKNAAGLPDHVAEALEDEGGGGADTIKVDAVVEQYFSKQALQVLAATGFTDAVTRYVSKDDKHAVEHFVGDSLKSSVDWIATENPKSEGDIQALIEKYRDQMEKLAVSGQMKLGPRRRYKDKPSGWDSDVDGHWYSRPEAVEIMPPSPEPAASGRRTTQPASGVTFSDDEDGDLFGSATAASKAPAKKAPAPRATKRAAPAKKAPAAKPAAAKKAPARGRKKAQPFEDSDDDDQDDDVVMDDDEEEEPAPPKKAVRATRGAAKPPARQTTLNFSQSQRASNRSQPQKVHEISDDDISDDAFETMPTRSTRRRG